MLLVQYRYVATRVLYSYEYSYRRIEYGTVLVQYDAPRDACRQAATELQYEYSYAHKIDESTMMSDEPMTTTRCRYRAEHQKHPRDLATLEAV